MKILFLSDTHSQHRKLKDLPNADIVIHSGGGLDTYISRFLETSYSKPIAKIFSNKNFRYFR